MRGIRKQRTMGCFVLFASSLLGVPPLIATEDGPQQKRPVTVADSVEITALADPEYFVGSSATDVARFSPDGQRFVMVLRKANLVRDANDFSVLLFRTAGVFDSLKPKLLVTMSSSSNEDAIKDLKWLNDNRTIVFVGQMPGGKSAVFFMDTATGKLRRLTPESQSVSNHDVSEDGRVIVFSSEPSKECSESKSGQHPAQEVAIQNQSLLDLLAGSCSESTQNTQLFFQRAGKQPVQVPIRDELREDYQTNPISVSPSGRYALVDTYVRDIPDAWFNYKNHELQKFVREKRQGEASRLRRFLLLDTQTGSLSPLIDAPLKSFRTPTWAADGRSVLLEGSYLPPGVAHTVNAEGEEQAYDIEVMLPTKNFQIVSSTESSQFRSSNQAPLHLSLEEDVNNPPKIYVHNPKTRRKKLLLDLNPQLLGLNLGRVEIIRWRDDQGLESQGGLYLPPDYDPGTRYPLVIQTHGFTPDRFSMDGRFEWSSAFAARPLAAKGILVLQSPMFADSTAGEGPRELARYLGAINYLDQRGLIDRNRVGIVGFSRTVFEVAYALTHSNFHFAAASLVDGMDGGYFQYIAFGPRDNGFVNGADPFGNGLAVWLRNSPGFNLDKVTTPVRMLALGPWSLVGSWEWFTGLSLLNKPVDFVYLPDAAHMIVRPQQRLIAEQDLVDWFCFWLKGEEIMDRSRSEEDVRWRKLRELLAHEPK